MNGDIPLLLFLYAIVDKSSIYRFVSNSLEKKTFFAYRRRIYALVYYLLVASEWCWYFTVYMNCVNMHRNALFRLMVSPFQSATKHRTQTAHILNHISFLARLFIYFNAVSIFNNINKYMVFVFISYISSKNVFALNGINMK